MHVTHIHANVADLESATAWFATYLGLQPIQQWNDCHVFTLGPIKLALDRAPNDSVVTIALANIDCDAEYRRLIARGAQSIQAPQTFKTGSRTAIVQGPGALNIEIDQVLS